MTSRTTSSSKRSSLIQTVRTGKVDLAWVPMTLAATAKHTSTSSDAAPSSSPLAATAEVDTAVNDMKNPRGQKEEPEESVGAGDDDDHWMDTADLDVA